MSAPVKEAATTTVGKVINFGVFVGSLSYSIADKDTIYDLCFRNYKYTAITELDHIRFNNEGGAVDSLYSLMKTVFSNENRKNKDYAVAVTLGQEPISVSTYRSMGYPAVMILNKDGYGLFTEKQLAKLFGKN